MINTFELHLNEQFKNALIVKISLFSSLFINSLKSRLTCLHRLIVTKHIKTTKKRSLNVNIKLRTMITVRAQECWNNLCFNCILSECLFELIRVKLRASYCTVCMLFCDLEAVISKVKCLIIGVQASVEG